MLQEQSLKENAKHKHQCCVKCVSWSAIITGSIVAIGLGFLLNLFGVAIGLSLFTTDKEGLIALAIGGFLAMLIGSIVTMFVAGWVSGYLSREHATTPNVGALYGFATWCLALIITILLAGSMTEYVTTNNFHNYSLNRSPVVSTIQDHARNMLSDSSDKSSNRGAPKDEKTANVLGGSLLLTFFLFFLGAIASCLGGYAGLNLRCKESK